MRVLFTFSFLLLSIAGIAQSSNEGVSVSEYKGFLLEKGNSVYVRVSDNDETYERAGCQELKRLLKEDGFWNVVDEEANSHFEISYQVVTEGVPDRAYLEIWQYKEGIKCYLFESVHSNEKNWYNEEKARKLYKKHIVPLQRKILKKRIPNEIEKKFTIN